MTEQRIVVDIDDAGVATATLNRADKHNALDPAMFEALIDVTGTLAEATASGPWWYTVRARVSVPAWTCRAWVRVAG